MTLDERALGIWDRNAAGALPPTVLVIEDDAAPDALVSKPFDLDDLLGVVGRLMPLAERTER